MNYKNFRIESAPFGNNDIIRILPDDSMFITYLANYKLTRNGIVSERDMTQLEVDAAVVAANERLMRMRENSTDDNKDFWLYYGYDDLAPEDYVGKKISEYGPINYLENFLEQYSINRQAFPDANLLGTTELQYHAHELYFQVHTDEIDMLMKQWYEENRNIKEYEFKMDRMWQKRLDYWRLENQSMSEDDNDYEREAWEELTDGQEGHWEDWHDPRD